MKNFNETYKLEGFSGLLIDEYISDRIRNNLDSSFLKNFIDDLLKGEYSCQFYEDAQLKLFKEMETELEHIEELLFWENLNTSSVSDKEIIKTLKVNNLIPKDTPEIYDDLTYEQIELIEIETEKFFDKVETKFLKIYEDQLNEMIEEFNQSIIEVNAINNFNRLVYGLDDDERDSLVFDFLDKIENKYSVSLQFEIGHDCDGSNVLFIKTDNNLDGSLKKQIKDDMIDMIYDYFDKQPSN